MRLCHKCWITLSVATAILSQFSNANSEPAVKPFMGDWDPKAIWNETSIVCASWGVVAEAAKKKPELTGLLEHHLQPEKGDKWEKIYSSQIEALGGGNIKFATAQPVEPVNLRNSLSFWARNIANPSEAKNYQSVATINYVDFLKNSEKRSLDVDSIIIELENSHSQGSDNSFEIPIKDNEAIGNGTENLELAAFPMSAAIASVSYYSGTTECEPSNYKAYVSEKESEFWTELLAENSDYNLKVVKGSDIPIGSMYVRPLHNESADLLLQESNPAYFYVEKKQ